MALPVNKPTKADIVLIATILLISLSAVIFMMFFNINNAWGFEIKVDGKLYSSYSFSDLSDGEIIEIKTQYGYNKFLYKNRSIMCIESDCKDKVEIKTGAISKTNQVLVCLPHKLIVNIVGDNKIDAVSY